MNIERQMTDKELESLTENGITGEDLRRLTPEQKFKIELIRHEKAATKKGLPFASQVAMNDRADYEEKVKTTMKRMGHLPKDFKKFEINWDKYSNLENFDLIEEKEQPDTNLSNKNPGLNVTVKTKVYKFKGYGNMYIVMEDGPSAITRAVKNRAKLDKDISQKI